jgi:hypothetical protein
MMNKLAQSFYKGKAFLSCFTKFAVRGFSLVLARRDPEGSHYKALCPELRGEALGYSIWDLTFGFWNLSFRLGILTTEAWLPQEI